MAFVTLDEKGEVSGIFANPHPHLDGYAEIADDDSRISTYYEKRQPAKAAPDA